MLCPALHPSHCVVITNIFNIDLVYKVHFVAESLFASWLPSVFDRELLEGTGLCFSPSFTTWTSEEAFAKPAIQ